MQILNCKLSICATATCMDLFLSTLVGSERRQSIMCMEMDVYWGLSRFIIQQQWDVELRLFNLLIPREVVNVDGEGLNTLFYSIKKL